MSVTLVCPACDTEVPTDSTTGSVRCPTCWANVSVESARRKGTDTPPPKGAADGIPTARKAGSPPQAKRVPAATPGKKTRSGRQVKESNGWVWAVALAALVLAGVIGFVVFSANPSSETVTPTTPPPTPTTPADPEGEWVTVSTTDGATLLAPGPLTKKSVTLGNDRGVVHTAADGNKTAEVYVFDLNGNHRADTDEFVSGLLEVSPQRLLREGVRPIPGGDATEYAASDITGFDHVALVIGRGGRWYVFHLRWKTEDDPKGRRRAAFVAKAGVTWVRADVPVGPADPARPLKPTDPNPRLPPPVSPRSKADAEPITETWVAIDTKCGFAAVAPKGVRGERVFVEQKRLNLGGQRWQIEDGHCVYHVSYLDLPADFDPDVAKLLKSILPFEYAVGAESDATVGGKKGAEWQLKQWDKVKGKAYTVRCGFRLFVAFALSTHGKGYREDASVTQRADKFIAGLRFTFDPKHDDPYPGEPEWATMPNTVGFSAKLPRGQTSSKAHDLGFNPRISGVQYRTEAGGITFEVFVHDLPAKASSAAVVKELLGGEQVVSGPVEVRSDDRRAWAAYELGSPQRPILVRAAAVGNRVITLKAYPETRGDDRAGIREFRDKAARFFDQFVAAD